MNKKLNLHYIAGVIDSGAVKFVPIKITSKNYPSFLIRLELRSYNKDFLNTWAEDLGGKISNNSFKHPKTGEDRWIWSTSNEDIKKIYSKLGKYLSISHEKFKILINFYKNLDTIRFIRPEKRQEFIKKQLKTFDKVSEKMKKLSGY